MKALEEFTRSAPPSDLEALIEDIRQRLHRVLAVFNGKGGQGKTSITTHLAGLFADSQVQQALPGRVLVIDMDPQGNAKLDLGVKGDALDDDGRSLRLAVLHGTPLQLIRDVRPQLDVVPGGKQLEALATGMVSELHTKGRAAWLGLAHALAQIADQYDWILIDCPPTAAEPQELALVAARWVLVPISTGDEASLQGLAGVADRFLATEDLNPDLELLGAVLFDFEHRYYKKPKSDEEPRAVGQWTEVRAEVEAELRRAGSDAPLFDAVIRRAEQVAIACRKRGQLTFELARSTDGPDWWEVASGRKKGRRLPTSRAELVGDDYEDLAAEVMSRVIDVESEDVA